MVGPSPKADIVALIVVVLALIKNPIRPLLENAVAHYQ